MKRVSFVSMIALYFVALAAQAQQNKLEESEPAKVVKALNIAEMAVYQDPGNGVRRKKIREFVVEGSVKDEQIGALVGKALRNGTKVTQASHYAKLVKVSYYRQEAGAIATVTTRETTHLVWSSGIEFRQTDNEHVYTLECKPINTKFVWLVVSDAFNFQR